MATFVTSSFGIASGRGYSTMLIVILITIHAAYAQNNVCSDEVKKTKVAYDECMKMDMATSGYSECLKNHDAQQSKAEQACRMVAAQEICNIEKEKTKAIYDKCIKMNMTTSDYTECIGRHNTQRTKAEQSCRIVSISKCEGEKSRARTIYDKCIKMDKASSSYAICAEDYENQKNRTEQLCLAIYPQVAVAPASAAMSAAEAAENTEDEDYYENEGDEEKKGVRFGLRTAFNINDFSFGYKDLNRNIGIGYGFGGGLVLNVPIASILRFNLEVDLYYRLLFDGYYGDVDEAVVSVPILLQFGKSLYFTTGAQLDFPTSLTKKGNTDFMDNRASMDVGIVAGLSYMSTHFGLDFRYVYGLTSLFKSFNYNNTYYKSKSWLGQYGFGLSYFF
jgi:hypothetical protein